MENKNNVALYSLIFTIVGIFVGWLIWGSAMMNRAPRAGMHMMPDGSMMSDDGGDMGDMMHDMMSGLEGKTGDEFDKAFLSEMIVHHEGAVDMANAVLANSKRPELLKLAKDIISAQTKEIDMMKAWQKSWFNK